MKEEKQSGPMCVGCVEKMGRDGVDHLPAGPCEVGRLRLQFCRRHEEMS